MAPSFLCLVVVAAILCRGDALRPQRALPQNKLVPSSVTRLRPLSQSPSRKITPSLRPERLPLKPRSTKVRFYTNKLLLSLPLVTLIVSCASVPPPAFHCPRPVVSQAPELETQLPTVEADQRLILSQQSSTVPTSPTHK